MGKIDFWQDSIESIYEGKANKEPISVALLQAVKNSGLPKPILLRLIQAHVHTSFTKEARARIA